MKKLFTTFLVFFSLYAGAQNNSNIGTNSWQNSPNNWQNSPNNWQNSPNNWQNSPNNPNSNNGIYDQNGNRSGYITQNPSGTVNIFDNNGNRSGYSAPGR